MPIAIALLAITLFATVASPATPGAAAAAPRPYPLDTCIVSGEPLGAGGAPVVQVAGDRELKFCCEGCVAKFESDPAGYLARIDQELMERQRGLYPLSTCPVGGEDLAAAAAVEFLVADRLVRTCSPACRAAVEADPGLTLARLDEAAIARQLHDYPLETCVVAGGRLGGMGDPVDYLHLGRLVRFCCAACIPAFEREPAKYLAMLDAEAVAKATGKAAAGSQDR